MAKRTQRTKADKRLRDEINKLSGVYRSQRKIAKKLGVNQSTVSRILSGKTKQSKKISTTKAKRATKQALRGDRYLAQISVKFRTRKALGKNRKWTTKYSKGNLFKYSEKMLDKQIETVLSKLESADYNDEIEVLEVTIARYAYDKKDATGKLRRV